MAKNALHYETVSDILKESLQKLMSNPLLESFRLVGGTNLSLRFGHRKSEDIDLFTDALYESVDFDEIEDCISAEFPYCDRPDKSPFVGMGRSYYIGKNPDKCVKLDLMYTEPFMNASEVIDGIRMARVEDIIAMKLNVIQTSGRKKDFWDLHFLLDFYPIEEMIKLHKLRYPWEQDQGLILKGLINFEKANNDFDPNCLLLKDWDDIKLDFIYEVEKIKRQQ